MRHSSPDVVLKGTQLQRSGWRWGCGRVVRPAQQPPKAAQQLSSSSPPLHHLTPSTTSSPDKDVFENQVCTVRLRVDQRVSQRRQQGCSKGDGEERKGHQRSASW